MNQNLTQNNMSNYKKNLSNITQSNSVIINTVTDKIIETQNQTNDNTRVRWGPSIWFLFHTLSYKIKDSEFSRLKIELLDLIKSICVNLPCPTCASHATQYIQRLNYNTINNKDNLKMFFFNFHNDVNNRLGTTLFLLSDLDAKYENANTINIIKNFISVFQYKNKGFHMIANDMQRQRQTEIYKDWFNTNIDSFDK
jgi:hypothetical protein